MLPYEILVGFRGTMCTCARGYIGKKSLKQLNVEVQNLYKYSTVIQNNKSNLPLRYKDVNTNHIRRFHTQLLVNCHASPKDSAPIESDNISMLHKDPIDNMINLVNVNNKDDDIELHREHHRRKSFPSITHNIPESVKTWLVSDSEKVPNKEIEKRFPEPKTFLHNYYAIVSNETKIPNCLSFKSAAVNSKNKKVGWSYTYEIKWPEQKSFTSIGHTKASASLSASLKCLYWLQINNRIQNRLPIIYDKKEAMTLKNAPEELKVDKNVLEKVTNFLDKHEENIKEVLSRTGAEVIQKLPIKKETSGRSHPISHIRTDTEIRNKVLKEELEKRENVTNPDLPIFQFKSQILKELEENQALVIKGDTGCGKTTQVPQFIMDYFTEQGRGADCSMVVTEPRRISAISIAHRVAYERGESLGNVVGYQVRLQQVLPKQKGAILFCTTGVLLKKLQSNLELDGCSHVIIDEAHERSVDTDMLLVLLRRAMKINPSLKVVIMSATINADLFQEYLGCNSLEVPGRMFPVKMNFLDDIKQLGFSFSKPENLENAEGPYIDCDQISSLVQWINKNKPPGAILCFLPGWSHIQRVQYNLEEFSDSEQIVIPLHSRIPYETQKKIFDTPPSGIRKIILATDIAETGITVPDVVYVVDSACRKEIRWHEDKGLSSIDTHWISQANMKQRKGRAGRVQEGESFHLITKLQYTELEPYPLPEVLRMSLEQTVLDAKTYSNEKAEDFLGSMPQPPRQNAVKKAVSDLRLLGALDSEENLTALGKRIALFTIHPKLSKAMVYSSIFQCLAPVTSVAAALSLDCEVFYGSLTNKSRVRQTKLRFHPSSDHISMAWIYAQWANFFNRGPKSAYQFVKQYSLHGERMHILHKVRDINVEHLIETGLVQKISDSSDLQSPFNEFAVLDELVRGILLAGMDQVLKHRNYEFKKGRFTTSGTSMVTEDNAKAQLSPECVNYKRTSWPSPFLVYYQKTHHHERRTTLIRESSMISPLTVLLFSQGRIHGSMCKDENGDEDKVLLKISGKENVNLICDQVTADAILRFRDIMWALARYYVENNMDTRNIYDDNESNNTHNIDSYKKEMMNTLAPLLSSVSKSIDATESKRSLYDDEDYTYR